MNGWKGFRRATENAMLIFVFLFFAAIFTISGIFLSIEARQAGMPQRRDSPGKRGDGTTTF